jgi:hypothetical protein
MINLCQINEHELNCYIVTGVTDFQALGLCSGCIDDCFVGFPPSLLEYWKVL